VFYSSNFFSGLYVLYRQNPFSILADPRRRLAHRLHGRQPHVLEIDDQLPGHFGAQLATLLTSLV
jgi:hypothetical protein